MRREPSADNSGTVPPGDLVGAMKACEDAVAQPDQCEVDQNANALSPTAADPDEGRAEDH